MIALQVVLVATCFLSGPCGQAATGLKFQSAANNERVALRKQLALDVEPSERSLRFLLRLRLVSQSRATSSATRLLPSNAAIWSAYEQAIGPIEEASSGLLGERVEMCDRLSRPDIKRLEVRLDLWGSSGQDERAISGGLTRFLAAAEIKPKQLSPQIFAEGSDIRSRFCKLVERELAKQSTRADGFLLAQQLWRYQKESTACPSSTKAAARRVLLRELEEYVTDAQNDGWSDQEIREALSKCRELSKLSGLTPEDALSGWRRIRFEGVDWGLRENADSPADLRGVGGEAVDGSKDAKQSAIAAAPIELWRGSDGATLPSKSNWSGSPLPIGELSDLRLPPNIYRFTFARQGLPDVKLLVRVGGEGSEPVRVACPAVSPAGGIAIANLDRPETPGLLLTRELNVCEVIEALQAFLRRSKDDDSYRVAVGFLEIVAQCGGGLGDTDTFSTDLRTVIDQRRNGSAVVKKRQLLAEIRGLANSAPTETLKLSRRPFADDTISRVVAYCSIGDLAIGQLRPLQIEDLVSMGMCNREKLLYGKAYEFGSAQLLVVGAAPIRCDPGPAGKEVSTDIRLRLVVRKAEARPLRQGRK